MPYSDGERLSGLLLGRGMEEHCLPGCGERLRGSVVDLLKKFFPLFAQSARQPMVSQTNIPFVALLCWHATPETHPQVKTFLTYAATYIQLAKRPFDGIMTVALQLEYWWRCRATICWMDHFRVAVFHLEEGCKVPSRCPPSTGHLWISTVYLEYFLCRHISAPVYKNELWRGRIDRSVHRGGKCGRLDPSTSISLVRREQL
ncbi:hypothetical protein OF83DRAFT_249627 [Amylostereum chailletii]|nr:hypothetical protein OF83DRAFT_249627 [Amylostereum chailletii]